MPRTIADLTKSLAKFIEGPGSDSIWEERVRPHVMGALQDAVEKGDTKAIKGLDSLLEVTTKEVAKEVHKNPPETRVFSMAGRLGACYDTPASENSLRQIYSHRLIRNFTGLICTARLAVAAKQLSQSRVTVDSFQTFLNDAVETFSGKRPDDAAQPNGVELGKSAAEIVQSFLLNVLEGESEPPTHPQAVLTALYWTLHWLESEEKRKEGLWQTDHGLWLPIAAYATTLERQGGAIAGLSLQRLRPIEGLKLGSVLIEHPDQALRPLDEVFVNTIRKAWEWGCLKAKDSNAKDYLTCWSVAFDGNTPFSGSSIGGAAGAGFRLLHEGKRYDPSCLIIGQVDWDQASPDETPLIITGHEKDKTEGARSHQNPRIRSVLLGLQRPQAGNVTSMTGDDIRPFEDGNNFRVERVATLEKACEIASGELELLQDVLEAEVRLIREQAGRRIGRTFRDWRDLEDLFVPVRVARGLRPKLTKKEQEDLERARSEGQYELFDERLAIRRVREGAMGEEAEESEQRREHVALDDIRNELDRAVILGDPGFGKTNLLWHEAILRAQESLEKIRDPQTTADGVVLVVFVPAADWTAKLADYDSEDEAAAHARDSLINLIISRSGKTDEDEKAALKSMLTWKFVTGKCFIAVDALDEVPGGQRANLRAALQRLADGMSDSESPATIWAGSRYANYTGAPFRVEDDNELELLPFELHQQQQAIEAWFGADSEDAQKLWAHISSLPAHVQAILRNPLMLRFAMQIAEKTLPERKEIPKWQRRSDLYKDIVDNLVDRWARRRLNRHQRAAWCDFIEDVACGLWLKDAAKTFWDERVIRRLIGELGEAKSQLDEIVSSGLMTPAAEDCTGVPLMFTHRSIGEYLAASAMARRLNEGGTSSITLPGKDISKEISPRNSKQIAKDTFFEYLATKAWDPDWAQVVILLSGLLDDPWPLLEALYAEKHRDLSHDRVSLVIRCLAEIEEGKRESLLAKDMLIELTEIILKTCRSDAPFVERLRRSTGSAIAIINPPIPLTVLIDTHDGSASHHVRPLDCQMATLLATAPDRGLYLCSWIPVDSDLIREALWELVLDVHTSASIRLDAALTFCRTVPAQLPDNELGSLAHVLTSGHVSINTFFDDDSHSGDTRWLEEEVFPALASVFSDEQRSWPLRFHAAAIMSEMMSGQLSRSEILDLAIEKTSICRKTNHESSPLWKKDSIDLLLKALDAQHGTSFQRVVVIDALACVDHSLYTQTLHRTLVQALGDDDDATRTTAARALMSHAHGAAIDDIVVDLAHALSPRRAVLSDLPEQALRLLDKLIATHSPHMDSVLAHVIRDPDVDIKIRGDLLAVLVRGRRLAWQPDEFVDLQYMLIEMLECSDRRVALDAAEILILDETVAFSFDLVTKALSVLLCTLADISEDSDAYIAMDLLEVMGKELPRYVCGALEGIVLCSGRWWTARSRAALVLDRLTSAATARKVLNELLAYLANTDYSDYQADEVFALWEMADSNLMDDFAHEIVEGLWLATGSFSKFARLMAHDALSSLIRSGREEEVMVLLLKRAEWWKWRWDFERKPGKEFKFRKRHRETLWEQIGPSGRRELVSDLLNAELDLSCTILGVSELAYRAGFRFFNGRKKKHLIMRTTAQLSVWLK